jgi:2'-5' RNA ligase
MDGSILKEDDSKEVFDHVFEGWSVWLEPAGRGDDWGGDETTRGIWEEARHLHASCGGDKCGLYPFVPHCTLLYNIKKPSDDNDQEQHHQRAENQLHLAWRHFQQQRRGENETKTLDDSLLRPSSFYFFHYPKSADNGRGFGCVISMLLLEKTSWLQGLFESLKETFPPDERHHANNGDFIPHMALVYAPESKYDWLQDYTNNVLAQNENKRRSLLQPFRARYLSLWSTEGRTCDWYRIATVAL